MSWNNINAWAFTYYILRKYLPPIIIGPSSSPSYLFSNKTGVGRRASRDLTFTTSHPRTPVSRKETYLWLRDSVRVADNRLKGGRSCLIRRKITLTIKLPLRKRVASRVWTPRPQTWMQTKVADFGRGAEQGLLPSVWRINQSSLRPLTVLSLWIWVEGFVTLTCQTTGCKSVAQQQVQPKSVFIWPTWYFFPSCLMKLYYGDNLNI